MENKPWFKKSKGFGWFAVSWQGHMLFWIYVITVVSVLFGLLESPEGKNISYIRILILVCLVLIIRLFYSPTEEK